MWQRRNGRGAAPDDQGGRPGGVEDAADGNRPAADRVARGIPRHAISRSGGWPQGSPSRAGTIRRRRWRMVRLPYSLGPQRAPRERPRRRAGARSGVGLGRFHRICGDACGVFRSRDGGAHWEAASTGLPAAPVWCLAVSPSQPDVAYAATSVGLYWSADGGGKWSAPRAALLTTADIACRRSVQPASDLCRRRGEWSPPKRRRRPDAADVLDDSGDVRALAVDLQGGAVFAATETGVYRSKDRGMTWAEAAKLPLARWPWHSSGWATAKTPGRHGGEGLFFSADDGTNWSKSKLRAAFVTSIRVDAAAPGRYWPDLLRESSRHPTAALPGRWRLSAQWKRSRRAESGPRSPALLEAFFCARLRERPGGNRTPGWRHR